MKQRVSWNENYSGYLVQIIAEYGADGWEFYERDGFELMWFPGISTAERVARAEKLLKQLRAGSLSANVVPWNRNVGVDRKSRQPNTAAPSQFGSSETKEERTEDHSLIVGGNVAPTGTEKEWGFETLYGVTNRIALKRVTLNPYEALSRQFHNIKDELYLVIEGSGQLELGLKSMVIHELSAGDVVHIPPLVVHRLIAAGEGIVIIEASTPEVTDIIRLDDHYGRTVNPDVDPAVYGNAFYA